LKLSNFSEDGGVLDEDPCIGNEKAFEEDTLAAPMAKKKKNKSSAGAGANTTPKVKRLAKTKPNGPVKTKKSKRPSSEEQRMMILNYMAEQGRPFNSTKVYENLQKTISHPQVKAVLAKLVEEGLITEKVEGRSSLFWINQDAGEQLSADDAKAKNAELTNATEQERGRLIEKQTQLQVMGAEVAKLNAEPSNAALPSAIDKVKAMSAKMKATIASLEAKSANLDPSQHQDMDELTEELRFFARAAKDRKRSVMDAIFKVGEGPGKSADDVAEEAGLELDPPESKRQKVH